MRKLFYPLAALFIFFSSIYSVANEAGAFNLQNYVYDEEGNPVFIKIYIDSSQAKSSNVNKSRIPSPQDSLQQVWNRIAQDDLRGSYIVIPIKQKKNKDDDESGWECPYCGRYNKASSNRCATKGCVLH